MNILYVSHEKDLNGASLSLLGLIDEIKKQNKVYVLSPYNDGDFISELKKRNVHIINSKYSQLWIDNNQNKIMQIKQWLYKAIKCTIFNSISAYKLKRVIKKLNIQIIHSNVSVINIGGLLSVFCKIPHVQHIREFVEEDFGWR